MNIFYSDVGLFQNFLLWCYTFLLLLELLLKTLHDNFANDIWFIIILSGNLWSTVGAHYEIWTLCVHSTSVWFEPSMIQNFPTFIHEKFTPKSLHILFKQNDSKEATLFLTIYSTMYTLHSLLTSNTLNLTRTSLIWLGGHGFD